MVSISKLAFITPILRRSTPLLPTHRRSIIRFFTASTILTTLPKKTTQMQAYDTGYLNARDAAALDADLMTQPGYSLEQLMELAGFSVAEAAYNVLPKNSNILIVAGPGNNGGDGLVAARHLVLFGHKCKVVYPKRSKKDHFINLVKQCEDVGVEILDEMPSDKYDAVIDAIFGFSFKGYPREPFASALKDIVKMQREGSIIISVDIPSGWDVDEGDVKGLGFVPDVLVSLTAPKLSARGFKGRHFVGGRFLPPEIGKRYNVKMPPYPGVSQVMEIPRGGTQSSQIIASEDEDWSAQYAKYCAEKEEKEFRGSDQGQNEAESGNTEDWAVEYAKYCAKKEKDFFENANPKDD